MVQLISHRTDLEPGSLHSLSSLLERNWFILYASVSSLNLFTSIYKDCIPLLNALQHITLFKRVEYTDVCNRDVVGKCLGGGCLCEVKS